MPIRVSVTIPLLLLIALATPTGAAARPNVVFVLVDDLGWSDVGFNGGEVYETPHVDRLARQGIVFTDFYAAGPVCSPTRASILTGKYPARTGVTTYLLSPERDAAHVTSHLPLQEFTIAEAFQSAGYATGYFGKWHLGYKDEHWAAHQGFEVAKGGIDLPWAWKLCYPDRQPPTAKTWPTKHTRFFSPYHLTHLSNGPEGEYLTDRLTTETIRFIEQHKDQPFFAFLSFHTVHTPLQTKREAVEKYQRKMATLKLTDKRETNRREKQLQSNPHYAAMVQHMDDNVGRLLRRLDELKLAKNTIVVFTSDNGGKGSVTSNLPLRGMKHNLYEGGIRVPLVVRWPGKLAAGRRDNTPLITNDLYPTLLDLAEQSLPAQQQLDGVSFKQLLLGESDSVEREAIYWHYPHGRQEAAVRMGRYKLLHFFKTERTELYDLQQDIGERHDLSNAMPKLARSMLNKLRVWQHDVGARFAKDRAMAPATKPPAAPSHLPLKDTEAKPFGVEKLNPLATKPIRTDSQLKQMPNVLFISVDDWNDWVGCLGNAQAKTANVDRLARRGVLFTNAHCAAPVCNPSRVAVMTGLRPETTGVYENNHVMRRKVPDVVTLSEYFMQHGYEVAGGGKIYHDNPAMFDRASWNRYFHWHPSPYRTGGAVASPYSSEPDPEPAIRPARRITKLTKRNFDWAALDRPESDWPDFKVAAWASDFLSRAHERPFFLAVGIFRPHVPWFNPKTIVDRYPLDNIQLPSVKADDLADLGPWARRRAFDKASRHERLVEFDEWKLAVQAYLASISFADANVGRVLDALNKSRHRDNTIVVLWSDHGYHLGEKGHWHKRTLWERSTRVPLIIAGPGVAAGASCARPVNLLDLYPTLVDLCGLDPRGDLEGHSLQPLLENQRASWQHASVTTWQPDNQAVRTERWRYIRYATGEEELYDHSRDPHEWYNLAGIAEHQETISNLKNYIPRRDRQDGRSRASKKETP